MLNVKLYNKRHISEKLCII